MNANIKFQIVPSQERADCLVRAYAASMNVSYDEAYVVISGKGRKAGCRAHWNRMAPALGYAMVPELSCMTVESALQQLPAAGRFVFKVSHHVFAVVDGVVFDYKEPKAKQRVEMVYQAPVVS